MASLILVHKESTQHEEIVLNADQIESATSTTQPGGTYTRVRMANNETHAISESLGELVSLVKPVS